MGTQSLLQRLKALEKEIQNSEVEAAVRKKQLSELKPKREAIEEECLKEFGCQISELGDLLAQKEAVLESQVVALELSLTTALSGDQEPE